MHKRNDNNNTALVHVYPAWYSNPVDDHTYIDRGRHVSAGNHVSPQFTSLSFISSKIQQVAYGITIHNVYG